LRTEPCPAHKDDVHELHVDAAIYLELPGIDSQQRLNPGRLLSIGADGRYHGRFDNAAIATHMGKRLLLYFEASHRFTFQPVDIVDVCPDFEGVRVAMQPVSPPASAENRECYRVSAESANLLARLGGEAEAHEVLDVSATGFAAYVSSELAPGSSVRAALIHDGEITTGRVRVRNVRITPSGRLRCGLSCAEDTHENRLLLRTLPRINLELQRRELAMRSGLNAPPPPARYTPSLRRVK